MLEEIIVLATDKVNLGRQLMTNLKDLLHIEGVQRIQKQISHEVNSLLIAINEGTITSKLINSSKLLHLECLVKILLKCRAVTSVEYVLPLEESETDPMRIDIVCENGACSVNVEAKNLHTLTNSLAADGGPGGGHQRILNQAEEFVEAATSNPEAHKPPQMCLIFDNELQDNTTGGGGGVDGGQGSKTAMDDNILDFVNSIVRCHDQSDRQWEFHLNNANQSEVAIQPVDTIQTIAESKPKDLREYKRIQMQQRRANPIIRSAESDRKRKLNLEKRELQGLGPPRKYQKHQNEMDGSAGEQLLNDDDEEEHEEDPLSIQEVTISNREYKTETEGVFELVQDPEEMQTTVVVMNQPQEDNNAQQSNATYSESHQYFCDSCKDSGLAYEQEILRLREELKQKDAIINSLKSVLGPNTRIIMPGDN